MKRFFTFVAAIMMAAITFAQAPIWTAKSGLSLYPADWGYDSSKNFLVGTKGIGVESYEGYTIIRSWCGVEGYDIAVAHNEASGDYMVPTTVCQVNGDDIQDEDVYSGYYYVQTGLEDYPWAALSLSYEGSNYAYLTIDFDDEADNAPTGSLMFQGAYLLKDKSWSSYTQGDYFLVWPESDMEVGDDVGGDDDPDTPMRPYNALGEIKADADWSALGYKLLFPATKNVSVESNDGYFVVRAWAGNEGYDLKVAFDDEESITALTPIYNGVEQEPLTENGYVYTGTEQVYVDFDYSGASSDDEAEDGYLMLYITGPSVGYYNLEWPQGDDDEPVVPGLLYSSLGQVKPTEGWGETPMPTVRDVVVEAYADYVILRGFAGVEGYDMKVCLGDNDAVTGIASIVNGVEGETVTSGNITVPTGRDDFGFILPSLEAGYGYGASDAAGKSGYVILSANIGEDEGYYNIVWPQGDDEDDEPWVNPFEGEATLLYSTIGTTSSVENEPDAPEDELWDETVFPTVTNVKIDVYDKYIYIHDFAGVKGYDVKVAYNADEEVTSIMAVTNGEEGTPCKDYIYLYTGREDVTLVQAYTSNSYAATYDDKTGYVTLSAYIYNADDSYKWNYYNITWDNGVSTGVNRVEVSQPSGAIYNLLGQKVGPNYKGIVIRNGRKVLMK